LVSLPFIKLKNINDMSINIKTLTITFLLLPSFVFAQEGLKLNNKIDSVSYALAINIATNIKKQGLKDINLKAFNKAFDQVINEESVLMDATLADEILKDFFTNKSNMTAQNNLEEGTKFLEENGKKEGITTLESGLQYKVIEAGTGAIPTVNDQVKTHYRGTLIDGTVFDSSYERGEPITFQVTGVIKRWTEALLLMKAGAKWKLFIPADLAYGSKGAGGVIPANAALIFDIELISIEK